MASKCLFDSRRDTPPITFLMNDIANRGSMPPEQSAMMLMDPVGAIADTVALRMALYFPFHALFS